MLKESFLDELFVGTASEGSSVLELIESFLGVLDLSGFELVFRLFGILAMVFGLFGDDDLKRLLR